MDSRKLVLKETAVIAVGQVICVGLMLGVFAMLGKWDSSVLLGGIVGGVLATLNFLFMAIGTSLAADKAEKQDVKGGKAMLQSSYLLRTVVLFVIAFAAVKSGLCNVLSLLLPLVFVRPILTVGEFFRKKEDN